MMGSICGKTLQYNKSTFSKLKLGYARILVEIDAIGEFLESIDLQDKVENVIH